MNTTLELPEAVARRWSSARSAPVMARCTKCKAARRVELWAVTTTGDWGRRVRLVMDDNGSRYFVIRCVCGAEMNWKELKASTNEAHQCDQRCTSAVGPSCDCSCGGRNHGRDHG